jgi:hypothetical protein
VALACVKQQAQVVGQHEQQGIAIQLLQKPAGGSTADAAQSCNVSRLRRCCCCVWSHALLVVLLLLLLLLLLQRDQQAEA